MEDYPKKPKQIIKVKPSKYGATEAIHNNKKYWQNVFENYATVDQDVFAESKRFCQVLPRDLYKKVCNTLNFPIMDSFSEEQDIVEAKIPRRMIKNPMLSFRTSIHIDREAESDTEVEVCPSDDEEDKPNIHKEFLSKPEREQVTWATRYLQPEKEEEKSLIKKADDLTDRIANDFCKYMKEMGGNQQSDLFTPKTIKDLFQIEFDTHVTRSLRIITKELPTVDERVANVTGNPDKSQYAALERQITTDILAEEQEVKTTAFNRSLPLHDQVRPPKNNTRKLWRSARHVPEELVTLKTVWEGITNLRSVKEYCRWMIDHPKHRKPPYLNTLGMFDPNVLEAKLSFESKTQATSPVRTPTEHMESAPIENIRRRLSQLADST